MSFTYDATNPTSNRDRVRLLIGDTNVLGAGYVFEDEELDAYLSMPTIENDVIPAAVLAVRTLALNQAKQSLYYSINGLTMDRRRVAPTLLEVADRLEKMAEAAPWEYESILDHLISDDGRDLSSYADGIGLYPHSPGSGGPV